MAQLAPIATALGAGASLYGVVRGNQTQAAQQRAQQAQEQARAQQAAIERAAETRAREARLEGTIASTRARLAAGGVSPDGGSAAALTAGLRRDAAAAEADSAAVANARLASGRRSLLNDDGSLTSWLRAGASFGNSLRSLLD
jgi:uncharacterized protein HemX